MKNPHNLSRKEFEELVKDLRRAYGQSSSASLIKKLIDNRNYILDRLHACEKELFDLKQQSFLESTQSIATRISRPPHASPFGTPGDFPDLDETLSRLLDSNELTPFRARMMGLDIGIATERAKRWKEKRRG